MGWLLSCCHVAFLHRCALVGLQCVIVAIPGHTQYLYREEWAGCFALYVLASICGT